MIYGRASGVAPPLQGWKFPTLNSANRADDTEGLRHQAVLWIGALKLPIVSWSLGLVTDWHAVLGVPSFTAWAHRTGFGLTVTRLDKQLRTVRGRLPPRIHNKARELWKSADFKKRSRHHTKTAEAGADRPRDAREEAGCQQEPAGDLNRSPGFRARAALFRTEWKSARTWKAPFSPHVEQRSGSESMRCHY